MSATTERKTKFTLNSTLANLHRNGARNQAPVVLLTQNHFYFQQVGKAQNQYRLG